MPAHQSHCSRGSTGPEKPLGRAGGPGQRIVLRAEGWGGLSASVPLEGQNCGRTLLSPPSQAGTEDGAALSKRLRQSHT